MKPLEKAQSQREQHPERNRYIHVDPPGAQAGHGRCEERLTGISYDRHGDRGGEEIEYPAQGRIGAGPDSDGHQHDIARAEARHGHGADQPLAAGGRRCGRSASFDHGRRVAQRRQRLDGRHRIGIPRGQRHRDPPCGQVDPSRRYLRQLAERPLDRGDALAAADIRH